MSHFNAFLTVCLLLFAAAPSFAADETNAESNANGLAMHGVPKYGPDATHLSYTNPNAPKGGTLHEAAIGSFDTLNPFALKGTAARGLNLVYDRLMQRVWDEPFTMYPLIAQSVDVPEDRSALTVHLDPAARFSDGAPITTADVAFSFETLKAYGRPNMRRIYGLVDTIEITDARTITFRFGPGYDQETVMILAMMPVLSETWWEGRNFDATLLDPPVSSGPYLIDSFEPGRQIIYRRNPDYWAAHKFPNPGLYNFERVIFDYFRDDTVAFEAFKAGDLSIRRENDAGRWFSAYDFPRLEAGDVKKQAFAHQRPERTRGLIFNTRRAPFDDLHVRAALQHAFDAGWINDNFYHGAFKRLDSYFANSELAARGKPSEAELALLSPHQDSLPETVFGPAWAPPAISEGRNFRAALREADRMLQEAGWVIEDGKRVRALDADEHFSFEILVNAPEEEKIILHYIRALERLGITANLRVLDSAAFVGRLQTYDYDMILHHWQNSLSPGTEQMLYWSCEAAEQQGRFNYAGICSPAVDDLAARLAQAKTREELVTAAHALDRVLTHNHLMIPLFYDGEDHIAFDAFIQQPEGTAIYGPVTESWWADPAAE